MSHWEFLGMDFHISGCAENRQPATEIWIAETEIGKLGD